MNIPWPHAGMGDPEYLQAFNQVVMPISQEFAPDLVIGKLQLGSLILSDSRY